MDLLNGLTALTSAADNSADAAGAGKAASLVGWILLAIAAVIACAGMFHALKCFMYAFIIAHNDMKLKARSYGFGKDDILRREDGSYEFYEDVAVPGYFNRGLLTDFLAAVSAAVTLILAAGYLIFYMLYSLVGTVFRLANWLKPAHEFQPIFSLTVCS